MQPQRISLLATTCLTLLVALPLHAQDKPVTLTRTFKAGDVTRRKTESDVTAGGMDVKVVTTSKTTIKEVKDNGQVVAEEVGEGGKVTIGGSDMDIPASPAVTSTRDKYGKLVELKKSDAAGIYSPEIMELLADVSGPILADHDVKPGDTWETTLDNPAVKGKKVTIKTTYVGTDKVEGADLWKLKQTSEADTDGSDAKLTIDSTVWLDPANGQEVQSESTIKGLPSQYGALDMKSKTTRLKADAKA